MAAKLKPLKQQTIAITGASSGIGLSTARMVAKAGAAVALFSRNQEELDRIATEIRESGGRAIAVAGDVADPEDVDRFAQRVVSEFGTIDTWINNAGLSIYGRLDKVPLAEKRRLFDVNFWGVVHGCRSSLPILKRNGGALINVGSVVSERAVPEQGIYSASKHAVKAYTDALRMEVEADGLPVSVTLIKPAAINTPFTEHAVNHMDAHPSHVPPVYAPDAVARAILNAAVRPERDVYVGGSGPVFGFLESAIPRLTGFLMEKSMVDGQKKPELDDVPQEPALWDHPRSEGQERGSYSGHVMETSAYTAIKQRPVGALAIAAGLGLAAGAAIQFFQNSRRSQSLGNSDVATAAVQGDEGAPPELFA